MRLTALSTYVNCISAILELLKTLKKSRADLTIESSFVTRNAATETLVTFKPIDTAEVPWGKLKPSR